MTAADLEAQRRAASKTSHWSVLVDQAGVNDEVLNYRYAGEGTAESPYLVDFLPNDARNPMTLSQPMKWFITLIAAVSTLAVAFTSSAYSGGVVEVRRDFGVSSEVVILGVSMFVLGFADMFTASEWGMATGIFAMAPFLGPALGPIAGGFLGETAGWRWVEGMTAIFTGVLWIVNSVVYPETYAPVLLHKRAAVLSKRTGKVYVYKLDTDQPKKSVAAQFAKALSRPWMLLFREPIVLLTAMYMAIIYGTLYMCFAAFPIVFQQGRGWKPGIGGLAFTGIAVGMLLGTAGILVDNRRYQRAAAKAGGVALPEARLPPALVGSVLLPVGLFWFAWTNGPGVHWAVSITGSALFAAGILLVFLSLLNYLVDSYVVFAASVLAANSVLRSLLGAVFPLFTTYMYDGLGIHWASSIPAFLALACVPFPFLFYRYGARIRMRCKYAAEVAHALDMMRSKHMQVTEDEAVTEADERDKKRRHSRGGGHL